MLRIYSVCLEMVREVASLAIVIKAHDRDLCRQLQRARLPPRQSDVSILLAPAQDMQLMSDRRLGRTDRDDKLGQRRTQVFSLDDALAYNWADTIQCQHEE